MSIQSTAALKTLPLASKPAVREVLEQSVLGGQIVRYSKSGSGRPLVLIHTLRTQLEYFDDVIPLLSRNFTVYAVDLPGHGESSIDTSAPYDEPYHRRALVEFIQTVGLQDVVLAGESIGGALALSVSAELKGVVTGVVSSNPYDYDKRYGDGVRRGNFLANFILFNFSIPVVGAVFALLENPLILAGIMRGGVVNSANMPMKLVSLFDRTGRRSGYRYVERKMFSGWRSWGAVKSTYSNVSAPVLLFQAVHDWATPQEQTATALAVPHPDVVKLTAAGHFAFREKPMQMAEEIIKRFGK